MFRHATTAGKITALVIEAGAVQTMQGAHQRNRDYRARAQSATLWLCLVGNPGCDAMVNDAAAMGNGLAIVVCEEPVVS